VPELMPNSRSFGLCPEMIGGGIGASARKTRLTYIQKGKQLKSTSEVLESGNPTGKSTKGIFAFKFVNEMKQQLTATPTLAQPLF